MNLLPAINWLRIPSNHAVIARWTRGEGTAPHRLELPALRDPDRFELLALGDTGDSDPESMIESPQDAVARELAAAAAIDGDNGGGGRGRAVLHTGDVVYMTGERRLYDRNFRRPYAPFLTPESTFENLVFRLPFLPVPGNHDYYDFMGWAAALVRVPLFGRGLRAIARELFAFNLPQGGSGMGRAWMEAFVEQEPPGTGVTVYRPGVHTRLPNRYYQFSLGSVDVFALDSNTLDAPAPGTDAAAVRAKASRRVRALRDQARALDAELQLAEAELENWRAEETSRLAADPQRRARLVATSRALEAALAALAGRLGYHRSARAVEKARRALAAATDRLELANPAEAEHAVRRHVKVGEQIHAAMRAVEDRLVHLAETPERRGVIEAHAAAARALTARAAVLEPPLLEPLAERLRRLSDSALGVQRKLTTEIRRQGFVAEDYDGAQLEWLRRSIETSVRERPHAWRFVVLHHPPYTASTSYCEQAELAGIRENLIPIIREHVHLVLCGHSHSFEWLRSEAAPRVAFVVSGGGGQIVLGRSVLDPRRIERERMRVRRLHEAGVTETVMAGRGPAAADGEGGGLWHYLRIEVSPDRIRLEPVGVRRVGLGYRREWPIPVHHAMGVEIERPQWQVRRFAALELRRDAPPEPIWGDSS